ncbi:MAG: helix-turn-helix domain-containing protein [Candidatus Altiarchaeota archaeon]
MKAKARKLNIALSPEEFCPTRQSIRILGKQWTLLIIKELYFARYQRLAFMEISKKLKDASSKVLSERLKEMVQDGIVKRREMPDAKPPRVYYSITPKGRDACRIIGEFKKYGIKWGNKTETFDCKNYECELCTKQLENGGIPAHHQKLAEKIGASIQV